MILKDIKTQKPVIHAMRKVAYDWHSEGAILWPIALTGPAGIGKSEIAVPFCQEMAELMGAETISVESASMVARADAPMTQTIIEAVRESANGHRVILCMDEVHELPFNPFGKAPGPCTRFWNALIYGSGRGWNRSGELEFAGDMVPFNAGNILFIGMSNHLRKMGGGGKNYDAVSRRFQVLEMQKYSDREMRSLLPEFFTRKGFTLSPEAVKAVSMCHRGTFSAAAEISQHLSKGAEISLADIEEIRPFCNHQSRGFIKSEMMAMLWIYQVQAGLVTYEPTTEKVLTLNFPSLDLAALYGHSKNQVVKGEISPFLTIAKNGNFSLSEDGVKFIKKNLPTIAQF